LPGQARVAVHAVLRRFGLDLVQYSPVHFFHLRRVELIADKRVGLVVDVGANEGQYARRLRADGYAGRILSLEPLAEAFSRLSESAGADDLWTCRRLAAGTVDGSTEINVAANSWSSSLLAMDERHIAAAPESAYVARETVTLTRLDSLVPELIRPDDAIFLKIDVQGAELEVLQGAERVLRQVQALEVELSFAPLYEGQALMPELVTRLHEAGFNLVAVEPVFSDPESGELLQSDGLFVRRT
jgi:FkbM family methyltransferase